jgi:hypothetical protein
VAATGFALLAVVLMGSVAGAPRHKIYGFPSDPLGEVWRLGQFDRGEIALVGDDVSNEANAPSGVRLRRPADASQILYDVPASLLARALGPVTAYNLLVFLALSTAGLAAYGALRWLGAGPAGSAIAGVLFALAPVHLLEAQLHLPLAFVFMLPILVALGIRTLERPSWRRGALLGGAVALCGYVTAYLLLVALTAAAALAVAAIVRAFTHPADRPQLARAAAAATVTGLGLLLPLLIVLLGYGGTLGAELNRPLADVATFSLRARDYVDQGSTAYIGLVGLVLAVAGLLVARTSNPARWTFALVGLAGFIVSLRPEASLLGLELPMPSKAIHSVVPYWRVFGRTAILAALAVACLAGLLVDQLSSSRRRLVQVAAAGLAVLAVADIVERPPKPGADLGRTDSVADVLRQERGAVAEYPLFGFDNYELGRYLLRQLRHGRPLLNGSIEGTVAADLASAASTLEAPEAPEALALAGVRTAVVHPDSPAPRRGRFRLEQRLGDGTTIYSVSPIENAAIVSVRGAYDAEAGPDGSPFRWLGPQAKLAIVADHRRLVTVRFDAVSPELLRTARFGTATREISTAPIAVALCVRADRKGTKLPISTTPAPRHLPGGDPRVAGIGVYHLRAEPGCPSG